MRVLVNRIGGFALLGLAIASWFIGASDMDALPWRTDPVLARGSPPRLHEDTPWAQYLAPAGTCRGDDAVDSSEEQQLFAMRCLLDWARRERRLRPLRLDRALNRSSSLKAAAIVRCSEFSHTPCGMDFRKTFATAGWTGSAGENIAWGASLARSPRVLVDGWLHSDGHRQNLFRAEWTAQGLAFVVVDEFGGQGPAAIWVHQFGI